ncbi:MAG: hypothetical protein K6T66_05155 [Peptococcaceae bacterium]|nr:hypothetical protein [Peptococcaceae bacterium]
MTPAEQAIDTITAILNKYADQMDLIDIIDIVDNLRILLECAAREGNK